MHTIAPKHNFLQKVNTFSHVSRVQKATNSAEAQDLTYLIDAKVQIYLFLAPGPGNYRLPS